MRDYHERLQFFILWFIDASSYINADDPNWEILLLIRKRQLHTSIESNGRNARNAKNEHRFDYSFVGYMTLYRYFALQPQEQPEMHRKWKLRISQVLILPPFQNAGHGKTLMDFVYTHLLYTRDSEFTELTVEDPNPSFQFLRDMMGQRCLPSI